MMTNKPVTIFLASLSILSACVWADGNNVERKADYQSAFNEMLSNLKADNFPGLQKIQSSASQLEKRGIAADTKFLEETILENQDRIAVWLALEVLLRGGGGDDGIQVLCKYIGKTELKLDVLVRAKIDVARSVASQLIDKAETPEVKAGAAGLLRMIGDKQSAALLRKAKENITEEPVRQAIDKAIQSIETRLRDLSEKEMLEWYQQEFDYANLAMRAWQYKALEAGIRESARRAAKGFTTAFLRDKIRQGDTLAFAIAGEQKNADLVDDILAYENTTGLKGEFILSSLAKIGDKKSMDALARQIKPGATKENATIARVLWSHGTKDSVEMLERLAADEKYKDSSSDFETAIKIINKRLENEKKQAEPPTSSTQSPPAKESQ